MKPEAIKEFYIQNGETKSINDVEIFNKIVKSPIYDVIRVIDGVPLFLEEHLDRMFDSAKLIGHDLNRSNDEIIGDIKNLILKNKIKNINIKLLSVEVEEIGKIFLVYCIESFYPPEEYYRKGIHTILLYHERQNPNAKILVTSFKADVTKELKDKQAFEALLVDKSGYIREGSKSNMFFIKGDSVYTAPQSEVLLGITRKHIFNVCKKLNIKIVEESIHIDEINKLDGAFISGTSVNVLPISSIGDIKINSVSNHIIIQINDLYVKTMEEYIINHKKQWI